MGAYGVLTTIVAMASIAVGMAFKGKEQDEARAKIRLA